MSVPFVYSNGVITVLLNGVGHNVDSSHPNYKLVKDGLSNLNEAQLLKLIDVKKAVTQYVGNTITVVNDEVLYKGEALHNVVANRIIQYMRDGLPSKPLINFLEKLMNNPSYNSRQSLYGFLEASGLPICEDGDFLAYKYVSDDFKDCYTGTFDNKPGSVNKMPRNSVDDNVNNACSAGFHVGTFAYANNGGNKLVLVKVNPANAVAVPSHETAKLRVCEYEVVKEISGNRVQLNDNKLHTNSGDESNYDYDDDDECIGDAYDRATTDHVKWSYTPTGGKYVAKRNSKGEYI